jgi:hypothetical protein
MSYRLPPVRSHVSLQLSRLPDGLTYYPNGTLDAPKRSEHVSAESVLTAGKINSDWLGELSE